MLFLGDCRCWSKRRKLFHIFFFILVFYILECFLSWKHARVLFSTEENIATHLFFLSLCSSHHFKEKYVAFRDVSSSFAIWQFHTWAQSVSIHQWVSQVMFDNQPFQSKHQTILLHGRLNIDRQMWLIRHVHVNPLTFTFFVYHSCHLTPNDSPSIIGMRTFCFDCRLFSVNH
jgi:hypothetical protein